MWGPGMRHGAAGRSSCDCHRCGTITCSHLQRICWLQRRIAPDSNNRDIGGCPGAMQRTDEVLGADEGRDKGEEKVELDARRQRQERRQPV